MINVETLALNYPALTRVPTAVFDFVTSLGIARLNSRILAQFARPSGWWGRFVGRVMTLEHLPVTEWCLSRLDVRREDRVLDAGCGAGNAIRQMLRQGSYVAGVDYSAAMVEQARWRNVEAIFEGRCFVRQGDIASLPFPSASFDKAVSIETLYFWPNPIAGLRELRRVLKPGGKLAIVLEYTRDGNDAAQIAILERQSSLKIYSRARVAGLFRLAGFEQVKVSYREREKWLYVEGVNPR